MAACRTFEYAIMRYMWDKKIITFDGIIIANIFLKTTEYENINCSTPRKKAVGQILANEIFTGR